MRTVTPQGNERHPAAAWVRQRKVSSLRGPKACAIPTAPSTFFARRRYGHGTGQGSQDERETPQERQTNEGAGESAPRKQEGEERVAAPVLAGVGESADFGLDLFFHD